MANPARWAQWAVRFAELYVDPVHGNYDPQNRIIRRPHNGSDPGRTGLFDGTHYPGLESEARSYGFPLDWLLPDGWYGGHYGWTWPHGWYSVGPAAAVAALAAAAVTGDDGYLDLLRPALDAMTG